MQAAIQNDSRYKKKWSFIHGIWYIHLGLIHVVNMPINTTYSQTCLMSHCIFTCQGIYSDVVLLLLKVALLFDWFYGHQMEPITEDLSLRKQKCSWLKWKMRIVYPLILIEKVVLIGWQTITNFKYIHKKHLQARFLACYTMCTHKGLGNQASRNFR